MVVRQLGPDHVVAEFSALDASGREWLTEPPAPAESPGLHTAFLATLLALGWLGPAVLGLVLLFLWLTPWRSWTRATLDAGVWLIGMVELDYRWFRRRLAWRRRALEIRGHRVTWGGRDVDPPELDATGQRVALGALGVFVVDRPLTRGEELLLRSALRSARASAASRGFAAPPAALTRLRSR